MLAITITLPDFLVGYVLGVLTLGVVMVVLTILYGKSKDV